MSIVGTNAGHGHVWERPDGVKARCGGPGVCAVCRADVATFEHETAAYCTSCDHLKSWHGALGCQHTVINGRPGVDVFCACGEVFA